MFNLETVESLYHQLNLISGSQIFPIYTNEEGESSYIIEYLKISFLDTDDKCNEEVDILLNEYVDTIIKDKKGFLKEMKEYGMMKWNEYKKRERMHYVYKCGDIEIPKLNNDGTDGVETIKKSAYDLYLLKMFVDNNYFKDDDSLFKDPPFWIKTMQQFKYLMIPLDCSTVYLFNPEQRSVLDLRKEEVLQLNL